MKNNNPTVLLIRDGWGIGEDYPGNAVKFAKTPNMDRYLATYPHSVIAASGESVGVRAGAQGSSEVGHLNMGAGRIVKQEILRVDELIRNGEFFEEPLLLKAARQCKEKGSKLHLMGLVQDQGVHATQDHLFALLDFARRQNLEKVCVHFFSDGRDTPPQSALGFLEELEGQIKKYQTGKIVTMMGRYWAMDRGENWERTGAAYDAMVKGTGYRTASARKAIEEAYERAEKQAKGELGAGVNALLDSGPPETDEFIRPTLILENENDTDWKIGAGDAVINFNFRQDRAIQITRAFYEEDFQEFERTDWPRPLYIGLTRYYDEFANAVLPPMNMANLVGEVVSERGFMQLRISEYQKFRHVTSFFNGKRISPYLNEDRVLVDSITIPENEKPEMSAYDVTDIVVYAVKNKISDLKNFVAKYDNAKLETNHSEDAGDEYKLIVCNLANCDMVGHTGVMEAGIKAVEVVDECVGKIVDAVLEKNGTILITADHGNIEQMIDPVTGAPQTSHTVSDVDLVFVSNDWENVELRERGILSDVGTTLLDILGNDIPAEITSKSLVK